MACNCTNPSPYCPCHRQVFPLTIGPQPKPSTPYWGWQLPQPIYYTYTVEYTSPQPEEIQALRPEDV